MMKGGAVLNTAIDNVVTAVVLNAGGDAGKAGDLVVIDSEQMTIATVTDATHWVVTRGTGGSTKAAHGANALVRIGVQSTSPTTAFVLRAVTAGQDSTAQLARFTTNWTEPATNIRMY